MNTISGFHSTFIMACPPLSSLSLSFILLLFPFHMLSHSVCSPYIMANCRRPFIRPFRKHPKDTCEILKYFTQIGVCDDGVGVAGAGGSTGTLGGRQIYEHSSH